MTRSFNRNGNRSFMPRFITVLAVSTTILLPFALSESAMAHGGVVDSDIASPAVYQAHGLDGPLTISVDSVATDTAVAATVVASPAVYQAYGLAGPLTISVDSVATDTAVATATVTDTAVATTDTAASTVYQAYGLAGPLA